MLAVQMKGIGIAARRVDPRVMAVRSYLVPLGGGGMDSTPCGRGGRGGGMAGGTSSRGRMEGWWQEGDT